MRENNSLFMNKSQRIYFNTGVTNTAKYINVQLEQDVDFLQVMSMNISTKDAYQNFNADYGVLIGRVIANGGVGVPNAKISIFIPLDNADANDGNIVSIYPYTTPRDVNSEGKRYNLLPRVSQRKPDGTVSPKQPFGSFPLIEEVVTNNDYLNVYRKYYKYTALTNSAGDYMIFGVPIGVQTVHMSVDITDIGSLSMNPAAMVTNLGYSPNFFMDNNTKIKPSNDLNDLPNIETQEIAVNVIPFWGDSTNFIIGISRQDFRIRSVLTNTFIVFGSVFTDGSNSMWGEIDPDYTHYGRTIRSFWRIREDANVNISIQSKRIGIVSEKIYYYPNSISDADIDTATQINNIAIAAANSQNYFYTYKDLSPQMLVLSDSQYSSHKRNGDFAFIISCNRNKVITDDLGNQIPVSDSSPDGIYTTFRGFITLELTQDVLPMNFHGNIGYSANIYPFRYRLKFPQSALPGNSFNISQGLFNAAWSMQNYNFSGGNYYTVSRFHGTVFDDNYDKNDNSDYEVLTQYNNSFATDDIVNAIINPDNMHTLDNYWNTGIIQTGDNNAIQGNTLYQMSGNSADKLVFGANWLNLSVHLPQVGSLNSYYGQLYDWVVNTNFTSYPTNLYLLQPNTMTIADSQLNTQWFARSDLHWTDFIKVPVKDIIDMAAVPTKGFLDNNSNLPNVLTGKYRNGTYTPPNWTPATPCPINGGKINGLPTNSEDPRTYFYKGFDTADCIDYLFSLGLVNI